LLDIIANRRNPDHGRVEYGETLRIGYFDQMARHMPEEMRVEEFFKREVGNHVMGSGLSPAELLEAFLFHPSVLYRPLGKLSGGEKRRILLVSILLSAPNFLILDEPTNDFDIATLTALEAYLDGFPGPVVTVSHDRWFLDRIASHLFLFRPDGQIQDYIGSASDYLVDRKDADWLAEQGLSSQESDSSKAGQGEANNSSSGGIQPVQERPQRMGNKERKELADLPGRIENLEKEIEELETKLSSGEANQEKLAAWGERHVKANQELERSMERWVELEELAKAQKL
ncbi:MAG: ATP-binding cassette domain-containing protein, partial [Leptospiraceae bacterium]|nr:ATP-binding cassette domain-containing protein [Leptospiraceae bacterium]